MSKKSKGNTSVGLDQLIMGGFGLAVLESVFSLVTSHSAMKAKMAGTSIHNHDSDVLGTVLAHILGGDGSPAKPGTPTLPKLTDKDLDNLAAALKPHLDAIGGAPLVDPDGSAGNVDINEIVNTLATMLEVMEKTHANEVEQVVKTTTTPHAQPLAVT